MLPAQDYSCYCGSAQQQLIASELQQANEVSIVATSHTTTTSPAAVCIPPFLTLNRIIQQLCISSIDF